MARALSKEFLASNTSFVKKAQQLYNSNIHDIAQRYSLLTANLAGDIWFFSSSGRAELIGNHTDHNNGLVIASCVDLDIAAAVQKHDENTIVINSHGYQYFTINLDNLDIDKQLFGTSQALVKGVVKGFLTNGYKVGGFVMNADSTILKGAGISSSAAFELLIAQILNVLYNNSTIDFVQRALISQYAENVYFGKPSGLMDQLTIARGGVSYMDFEQGSLPQTSDANWQFDNLSLVIINSGGDHSDLTDEYTQIRQEMQSIAQYFGKKVLREVDFDVFKQSLAALKQKFSGRAIMRAIHFFAENDRVKQALGALNNAKEQDFLQLINSSGQSSCTLLQNCKVDGDKAQPILLALATASLHPHTLASRVHGGGFAGTILTVVDKVNSDKYVQDMAQLYGKENVFLLSIRHSGTELVWKNHG